MQMLLSSQCYSATAQHCSTANSCGLTRVHVCLSQWLGDGALQPQNRQSCGCHHDHCGNPLYLLCLAVSCPTQNGKNIAGTAAFTHLPLSYESDYLDLFNMKSTENQLSFFFHIINDFNRVNFLQLVSAHLILNKEPMSHPLLYPGSWLVPPDWCQFPQGSAGILSGCFHQ